VCALPAAADLVDGAAINAWLECEERLTRDPGLVSAPGLPPAITRSSGGAVQPLLAQCKARAAPLLRQLGCAGACVAAYHDFLDSIVECQARSNAACEASGPRCRATADVAAASGAHTSRRAIRACTVLVASAVTLVVTFV
jgi:hypothetical protein